MQSVLIISVTPLDCWYELANSKVLCGENKFVYELANSVQQINLYLASYSDGHATLCRKRVFQINYFSCTHKTIYENVPNKLRNNVIQLDLANRKPQDRNGTIKYKNVLCNYKPAVFSDK